MQRRRRHNCEKCSRAWRYGKILKDDNKGELRGCTVGSTGAFHEDGVTSKRCDYFAPKDGLEVGGSQALKDRQPHNAEVRFLLNACSVLPMIYSTGKVVVTCNDTLTHAYKPGPFFLNEGFYLVKTTEKGRLTLTREEPVGRVIPATLDKALDLLADSSPMTTFAALSNTWAFMFEVAREMPEGFIDGYMFAAATDHTKPKEFGFCGNDLILRGERTLSILTYKTEDINEAQDIHGWF